MKRSDWQELRPIARTPEEQNAQIERSVSAAISWGRWHCPMRGCDFHRQAETKGGAIRVAAKHLRLEHRIRLTLAPNFEGRT